MPLTKSSAGRIPRDGVLPKFRPKARLRVRERGYIVSLAGGRRPLRGFPAQRKVRTPRGSTPRASAGPAGASPPPRIVSQKIYRPPRRLRLKRRGKSPPRGERSPRQDKPRAVQDRTGMTARPGRSARAGHIPGISRIPRKRGVARKRSERNGRPVASATDRIRLTATRPF